MTFEYRDGHACILDYEDYHYWLGTIRLIPVSSSPRFTWSQVSLQCLGQVTGELVGDAV
jgi:hypothetical protein